MVLPPNVSRNYQSTPKCGFWKMGSLQNAEPRGNPPSFPISWQARLIYREILVIKSLLRKKKILAPPIVKS